MQDVKTWIFKMPVLVFWGRNETSDITKIFLDEHFDEEEEEEEERTFITNFPTHIFSQMV